MSRLLHHLARDRAAVNPERTAIVDGDRHISYGELEAESNRVAAALIDRGAEPGDRVCVLMPKSIEALVSIHGALKAGCIYVPMDPASPAPRVAKVFASCRPKALLCDAVSLGSIAPLLAAAPRGTQPVVGLMIGSVASSGVDFTLEDVAGFPVDAIDRGRDAESPAHILFTSGSTGIPKGVVITHANVLAFLDWAVPYFGFTEDDRHSSHPPLHFDLSTFDIYGTAMAGAELHLVPQAINLLPHKIADFIRSRELTQWFSVPSLLGYMAKFGVVRDNDFPSLRRVLWCGEAFPTPSLVHWMQRLPAVEFTNLYGPTEATIASSFFTLPACPATSDAAVPIGTACAGEALLVLDEQLDPVSQGEVGDLYIAGVGLSPGYWEDEKKTRGVFIESPLGLPPSGRIYKTGDLAHVGDDGFVYFHGRVDSQIKSRGYRIELGEIESCLSTLTEVRESAVVAIKADGFEGSVICCAYVASEAPPIEPAQLRERLRTQLPSYMLPSRWVSYEGLPKNANGKIDRPALRRAFELGA